MVCILNLRVWFVYKLLISQLYSLYMNDVTSVVLNIPAEFQTVFVSHLYAGTN